MMIEFEQEREESWYFLRHLWSKTVLVESTLDPLKQAQAQETCDAFFLKVDAEIILLSEPH